MNSTLKVSALIEVLKKFHPDLPVYGRWEGMLILIREDEIMQEWNTVAASDVLIFDMDI